MNQPSNSAKPTKPKGTDNAPPMIGDETNREIAAALALPTAFTSAAKVASQFNSDMSKLISNVTAPPFVSNLKPPLPNPTYETNNLLRELSTKLDNLNEQNAKFVAPRFYADISEIIFANKRISIPKNTNQALLCAFIFGSPDKEWDWSEMLEVWGYDETSYGKEDWRIVYNAARAVNTKVAIETSVKDLLVITKKTTALNPNYLGQIS